MGAAESPASESFLRPAGVFIYPLEESEVVAGFEAETGGRSITFQIQNRRHAEDCCAECSPGLGQPLRCANGKRGGLDSVALQWRDTGRLQGCHS